ncbi:hypothetical protein Slin15195_G127860 [Septoria linicola]|uniref:Uncharacterized protein n=1 Tax=Septoria linicola TaxID=215465 RepID=A0A9Q9B0I8_9PEZI|nr:hypothetical protein Slin14017_G084010 [Septoria linicola]USW59467.1 hypothetical protein Slin15195_G127860 [Septoria linicola]
MYTIPGLPAEFQGLTLQQMVSRIDTIHNRNDRSKEKDTVKMTKEEKKQADELKKQHRQDKAEATRYAQAVQARINEEYDSKGPGPMEPMNLTLGVEIECLLLRNTEIPSKFDKPDEKDQYAALRAGKRAVHDALSRPAHKTCERCTQRHPFHLRLNNLPPRDITDVDRIAKYEGHDSWTVSHDDTASPGELEKSFGAEKETSRRKIDAFGIEIISRILGAANDHSADPRSDCAHTPAVTYQEEIEATYILLRSAFLDSSQIFDGGAWCLLVNDNCGLHVHIGNGASSRSQRTLPLETIQNVVSMYTANERAIDNMHPRNRITGSILMLNPPKPDGDQDNRDLALVPTSEAYNRPFSAHFAFMSHAFRNEPEDYTSCTTDPGFPHCIFGNDADAETDARADDSMAWLRTVQRAEKICHLRDLQTKRDHMATLNLGNIKPLQVAIGEESSIQGFKNTIEFRQAAATLDPVAALAWVDTVIKLVEYCHSTPKDVVFDKCMRICQDPDHHTPQFLALLGFGERDCQGNIRADPKRSPTFDHYLTVLGFVEDSADDYATRVNKRELATAAAFGPQHGFEDIRIENARLNLAVNNTKAVNRRIDEKFLAGCYGQYSTEYLDRLAFPADWPRNREVLQPKLTIGWVHPDFGRKVEALKESSSQDDERFISDDGLDKGEESPHLPDDPAADDHVAFGDGSDGESDAASEHDSGNKEESDDSDDSDEDSSDEDSSEEDRSDGSDDKDDKKDDKNDEEDDKE